MNHYIIIFLLAMCLQGKSYAQSVEEIIQMHVDAIGGSANWAGVRSIQMEAESELNGKVIEIRKQIIRDSLMRVDYTLHHPHAGVYDKHYYILIDGVLGWRYMPGDQNVIVPMLETDTRKRWDELDYEDPFVRYREKDREVQLLGIEYIHDIEYYKFNVIYPSGQQLHCYMNAQTWMIDVIDRVDAASEQQWALMNYRMVDGIMLPHTIRNLNQVIEFKRIEINAELKPEVFEPGPRNQYFMR
jgi:hypothetical protein